MSQEHLIVFDLSGKQLALPLGTVAEVLPMASLYLPPGSPPIIAGFLNLEGEMIPVLRLARLFGLAEREVTIHTPLILMKEPELRLALLVDSVDNIINLSRDDITPLHDRDTFTGCAVGEFQLERLTVCLLDPGRLFTEVERQRLADMEALAGQRLDQFAVAGT